MEAPNPKFQTPKKPQAPGFKRQVVERVQRVSLDALSIGAWMPELFWCLELGAWCFAAPPPFPSTALSGAAK
jgi:hypothetical protein